MSPIASFRACSIALLILFHSFCCPLYAKHVELKFWHIWPDETDVQKQALDLAIADWHASNPNIQIVTKAVSNESYKMKIRTAMAANEAPDLYFAWGGGFSKPYVHSGKVLALDPYLNDGTQNKILNGGLKYQTYDGKVYGLPINLNVGTFYVNQALFKKHMIKIPETFDELMEAVRGFRKAGVVPMTVGGKDRWPSMFYYDILALRTGGVDLNSRALAGQASFEAPAFVQAAELLRKLIQAKGFEANALSLGRDESEISFRKGKVPMYYNGSWVANLLGGEIRLKRKIVIRRFPMVSGGLGKQGEFLGGAIDAFWVNANTRHSEESVRALKFITERFAQHSWNLGGGLPIWKVDFSEAKNVMPLIRQLAEMTREATGFVLYWDMFLESSKAEQHKNLVSDIFAQNIDAQSFAQEMQKLNQVP